MESSSKTPASSNTPVDVSNEDVQILDESSIRKRKKTSEVWNHFSLDKGNDGKSSARCNHCNQVYSYGGSSYGTSSLSRHLGVCKRKPKFGDVSAMFLDHEGKLRAKGKNINQKTCREWITKVTIAHDLPLKWIEYKAMRGFLKYINPDIQFVTRNTIASDVLKMYESEKEKSKLELKICPGMVCLTSDVWTACTGAGYICVTAHFVDLNWKLNNKILAFCAMPPPHSGAELAQKIYDCLVEWEIDTKVFSLTLDNASANDKMVKILKSRLVLQKSLLSNGEYFHVRCCAHILNLIVQEGLKVASDALDKIRGSVKYVKGSEGRTIKFQECAKKVGIEVKSLFTLDVVTRWNSTYLMLTNAIKYRSVFCMLAFDDLAYHQCPSDEEWNRMEKMCEFLSPFYTMTNLISGSSYPTSNLYFMDVWKIARLLKKHSVSDDEVVREMAKGMRVKFDKYWAQYSEILAMGAVFDPRVKLTFLEYCYSTIDSATSKRKVEELKEKLYLLYEEYKQRDVFTTSKGYGSLVGEFQIVDGVERGSRGKGLDLDPTDLQDFRTYKNRSVGGDKKSCLDKYLEEELTDEVNDIDLLQFWKDKESRFGPQLARMACDVLSIPITTVTSESSFSIGAHVLTRYRNRLLPQRVQALICTHNWLHGYPSDDGEEIEDEINCRDEEGSNAIEVED